MIDPRRYRDVMSAFPSGVVIVTAFGVDGAPRGLTVNAFSAVSLEPPLALVCIDKSSNTLPAVQHSTSPESSGACRRYISWATMPPME